VRRRLRAVDVLAEIFNDSDSAESADDSDSDEVLYGIHNESQSEASDIAEDSDEEVVQQPPAKKGRSKALYQKQPQVIHGRMRPFSHKFTSIQQCQRSLLIGCHYCQMSPNRLICCHFCA